MKNLFNNLRKKDSGQGMVEYGLILALVSIVVLGTLGGIGGKLNSTFEQVVGAVSGGEVIQEDEILYTDEEIGGLVGEGYIPISTPDELNNLRTNTTQVFGQGTEWEDEYTSGLDKKYIQVANIDLSVITNFEPIGTPSNEFKGTFDGGGYVISNLKINRETTDNVGLFGRASVATLTNIGLVDVNVSGRNNVGGLVGYQQSSSTVSNSYATGEVNGSGNSTGGLVGGQQSSSVSNSYATGSVTCESYTGGLVGWQHTSSVVRDSYATGKVTGTGSHIGGLVGYSNSSSVSNGYATGSVNGEIRTGGLVGHQQSSSSTTNSYYDTQTTGRGVSAGGTGKTTAEMKKKETYVDWDFESIWTIESNQYPTLR